MQAAHAEIGRMRNNQSETRSWLIDTERSLSELRSQLHEIHGLAPSLEIAKQQTERLGDSLASIESRRGFVEDMQRRIAELGATSSELDDRGRQLQNRMDAAEQRFVTLSEQAEEAERLSQTVANVTTSVSEAARQTATLKQSVAAFEARCESVEDIAERTESLRRERDQRQLALEEAAKNLKQATLLRQEAATSAQELDELTHRLGDMMSSASERATHLDQVSSELEHRATHLQRVDKRLGQFEERLAKWEYIDQEVSRSLEQIVARQGTVQALQGDLDRMFTMAEQTSADVRTITSAHREIAESRALLEEVSERIKDIRNTENTLAERERQISKAEERLSRAEGLLVEVRASMESLQGQ
jgi:DNA repair exonuclease SbcCD ATPase subunit